MHPAVIVVAAAVHVLRMRKTPITKKTAAMRAIHFRYAHVALLAL